MSESLGRGAAGAASGHFKLQRHGPYAHGSLTWAQRKVLYEAKSLLDEGFRVQGCSAGLFEESSRSFNSDAGQSAPNGGTKDLSFIKLPLWVVDAYHASWQRIPAACLLRSGSKARAERVGKSGGQLVRGETEVVPACI